MLVIFGPTSVMTAGAQVVLEALGEADLADREAKAVPADREAVDRVVARAADSVAVADREAEVVGPAAVDLVEVADAAGAAAARGLLAIATATRRSSATGRGAIPTASPDRCSTHSATPI